MDLEARLKLIKLRRQGGLRKRRNDDLLLPLGLLAGLHHATLHLGNRPHIMGGLLHLIGSYQEGSVGAMWILWVPLSATDTVLLKYCSSSAHAVSFSLLVTPQNPLQFTLMAENQKTDLSTEQLPHEQTVIS
ncbi:hypothetical protein EYF80_047795 [Liparis tanakae]|uniref:Uncharacterized protein n=1 Tax=Liparis tanakae TaxID=230148 RepID=A0A4Z2FLN4_9TELE|nr:hypothetical protein EYF80_047795 [Liparis tanakae]